MNSLWQNLSCVLWYLKYVGLPLTIGVTIYFLISHIFLRRRRSALQGQVVVITGASSGLGEALAHAFFDHGSKVVLAARRLKELNRVKQDLISKQLLTVKTHVPLVFELDLADFYNMESFVKKVYDACGHIDILINNGGISHRGSIFETDVKVDKQIMDINYIGTVALTKAALPQMIERRRGHIVFISSVQGLIAVPERSAYVASKHALQAFGDTLRAEMHQNNINVSVISPGYIKTAISINSLTGAGDLYGITDENIAAGFTAEYVADKLLDGIVRKDNEYIFCQFVPRLGIFIRHFLPFLFFYVMAKRAKKYKIL